MSTFCQRLYHRKCQWRGVGGQKKPKSCQHSLWTTPYYNVKSKWKITTNLMAFLENMNFTKGLEYISTRDSSTPDISNRTSGLEKSRVVVIQWLQKCWIKNLNRSHKFKNNPLHGNRRSFGLFLHKWGGLDFQSNIFEGFELTF